MLFKTPGTQNRRGAFEEIMVTKGLHNIVGSPGFQYACNKQGVIVETAAPSEYLQATAADRLAAFRDDILTTTVTDKTGINDAAPKLIYTNRSGDALELTFGLPGKINGSTVDYQCWPMLQDPWMYQPQNGHLYLFGPNRVVTSNYYDWTQSINLRPTLASAATVPASPGTPVDIDLAARVADTESPDSQLHFTVSNPSNGSVTLLPDGKTARFTPTTSGPASFDFTTRDRGIHPRVVWHYDFESTTTRDASGHTRNATQTLVGSGTAILESDTFTALGPNSTQSLRLTEATPNAAKISRLVTRSNLEMSNGSWTFATWFKRASRSTEDFLFYIGAGDGFSGNGDELQLRCGANADTLRLEHYNAANASDVTLISPATAVQSVATFSGLSASTSVPLSVLTRQENWRSTHFGSAANSGSGADGFDPNYDGEINLLEFATGQNPHGTTRTITPLVKNSSALEFTYTRSLAALADGVTFAVEWSDTLANDWSTAGVSEMILTDNGTLQTVRANVAAGSGSRFIRLKITTP